LAAHLIQGPPGDGPQTYILLRRLQQTLATNAPSVAVSPSRPIVRVGENICLNAIVSGTTNFLLQWYWYGVPLNGATNATLCVAGYPDYEGNYSVAVFSADGQPVSPDAILSLTRPYVYPPARLPFGGWRVEILPHFSWPTGVLESSADLQTWQFEALINTYIGQAIVDLPNDPQGRFFRFVQPAP
jgi:hypothetical protein